MRIEYCLLALGLFLAACERHPEHAGRETGSSEALDASNTANAGSSTKVRLAEGGLTGEGVLQNGKKQGSWRFFHPDGTLASQGYFENGLRQGTWEEYDANGRPERAGSYLNGKPHGYWKFFAPASGDSTSAEPKPELSNPLTSEGSFVEGRKDGTWKFYRNGKLRQEGEFRLNQRTGTWREYAENGQLQSETIMK